MQAPAQCSLGGHKRCYRSRKTTGPVEEVVSMARILLNNNSAYLLVFQPEQQHFLHERELRLLYSFCAFTDISWVISDLVSIDFIVADFA